MWNVELNEELGMRNEELWYRSAMIIISSGVRLFNTAPTFLDPVGASIASPFVGHAPCPHVPQLRST